MRAINRCAWSGANCNVRDDLKSVVDFLLDPRSNPDPHVSDKIGLGAVYTLASVHWYAAAADNDVVRALLAGAVGNRLVLQEVLARCRIQIRWGLAAVSTGRVEEA